MLTIYIDEAHAKDDWSLPKFLKHPGDSIATHKTINDRLAAARLFIEGTNYPIQLVCDVMDNDVLNRYEGWPERLYVIENSGKLHKLIFLHPLFWLLI